MREVPYLRVANVQRSYLDLQEMKTILAEEEEIAFNAGSHTEVFRMAYKDFEGLVRPRVMSFTT